MDFKADALLLKAVDYGENDKMVTLLTAERGKIGAAIKGVRRPGAKLRFAAQPFCFAEYVFALKNDRYTVTQASLHDGFYDIRTDVDAFYAAACITEICNLFGREGMPAGALLICAVEALQNIDSHPAHPNPALVKFLVESVRLAGYPLSAENCPACGKRMTGRRYFDMASGAFNCAECAIGVPASESTYEVIHGILSRGGEKPDEADSDGYLRALRLLKTYIAYQAEAELPALSAYLKI